MNYLRPPYDRLARVLAGALVVLAIYGTGYCIGKTTAIHGARAARERLCAERIEQQAARHGFSVIRAAMPCEYERAR